MEILEPLYSHMNVVNIGGKKKRKEKKRKEKKRKEKLAVHLIYVFLPYGFMIILVHTIATCMPNTLSWFEMLLPCVHLKK